MSTYPKFGSIPRLHRTITITEKVDGSNGQIYIVDPSEQQPPEDVPPLVTIETGPGSRFLVYAGSRNRWLTEGSDNFAFAAWVKNNANTLFRDLGPGRHYGEWFGIGIQRGYGLFERRFALFNTSRFEAATFETPSLDVVPVLKISTGDYLNENVADALDELRTFGSVIVPGFARPEGIVVYHHAANSLFKVTIEADEVPKSLARNVIEFTPTEPGRYAIVKVAA